MAPGTPSKTDFNEIIKDEPKSINRDLIFKPDSPNPIKKVLIIVILAVLVLGVLQWKGQEWFGINLWGTEKPVYQMKCVFDNTKISTTVKKGEVPLTICKGDKCIKTYDPDAQLRLSPKESFAAVSCEVKQ